MSIFIRYFMFATLIGLASCAAHAGGAGACLLCH